MLLSYTMQCSYCYVGMFLFDTIQCGGYYKHNSLVYVYVCYCVLVSVCVCSSWSGGDCVCVAVCACVCCTVLLTTKSYYDIT